MNAPSHALVQEARNLQKYGEIPESVKVNETTEADDQNEDIVFGSDSELDDIDEVWTLLGICVIGPSNICVTAIDLPILNLIFFTVVMISSIWSIKYVSW